VYKNIFLLGMIVLSGLKASENNSNDWKNKFQEKYSWDVKHLLIKPTERILTFAANKTTQLFNLLLVWDQWDVSKKNDDVHEILISACAEKISHKFRDRGMPHAHTTACAVLKRLSPKAQILVNKHLISRGATIPYVTGMDTYGPYWINDIDEDIVLSAKKYVGNFLQGLNYSSAFSSVPQSKFDENAADYLFKRAQLPWDDNGISWHAVCPMKVIPATSKTSERKIFWAPDVRNLSPCYLFCVIVIRAFDDLAKDFSDCYVMPQNYQYDHTAFKINSIIQVCRAVGIALTKEVESFDNEALKKGSMDFLKSRANSLLNRYFLSMDELVLEYNKK
jgi:hypothetical protein